MTETEPYRVRREPRTANPAVRGLRHRLLEWGEPEARPVFYLHGWGDTAATFQFVIDALHNDWPDGWRVLAHDWRGFGETEWGGPLYWFPEYLADLDALLEAYTPDEPAVLIGHSMGANVAALYAGARPERVRGFVNIEGFGLPDSNPSNAPAHYDRWLKQVAGKSHFASYSHFDELAARVRKHSPRMDSAKARFVAREWAAEVAAGDIRLKADPAHRLPNAIQYRRAEAEACWQAIKAKTILIAGSETSFREAIESWFDPDPARRPFPGAELAVIENTGHMLHFEAPGPLAAAIGHFLSGL